MPIEISSLAPRVAAVDLDFHGASFSKSNTSIPSAFWQQATFQTLDFDTDDFQKDGSSMALFEIPADFAGKYLIIGTLRTIDIAYGLFGVAIQIDRGGGPVEEAAVHHRGTSPSPGLSLSAVIDLDVADTIEVRAYQDHAAPQLLINLPAHTFFNLYRIGV